MLPIRQTVRLSSGSVTLRAWGESVAEAHLTDLLTLTATLGAMREAWHEFDRTDAEPGVWGRVLAARTCQPGARQRAPASADLG